jgi:type I restriction enzyme, S subunit
VSAADWPTVALGELLTLRRDGVKVDPATNYSNLGLYSFGRGAFVKPPIDGSATSAATLYRVRAGQFIYSKLFAFEGAFAVVPPEMDGWHVSNEYPIFDIDRTRVMTDYLRICICRPAAWREMAGMTVGIGHRRQRLKPEEFLEYEVNLPSLDDQHRIVRAVWSVDSGLLRARRVRDSALTFLRALREERLVEDRNWRDAPGWEHVELSEVCDVALGFTKGRKLVGPTQMVPYLRAVNVQDGFIALDDVAEIEASDTDLRKFALSTDDVMLLEGCGNPKLVGRGWVWDGSIEPCLHQNSTLRARVLDPERVVPRFLAHAICASPARHHCVESMDQMSVAHLGLAGARRIPVPVPPRQVQEEIIRELDDARWLLVEAERKVAHYERARSALADALVTGELDLVPEIPPDETLAA